MLEKLFRHWWVFLLRGIAAIVFGIGTFVWPGITLLVLVALFAAYALVDGLITIIGALRHRAEVDSWWAYLLEGLLGVGIGVATWFWPGMTALVLLYVIALWAVATGILEIVAAWKLRHEIEGEWALGLAGLLSVLFGILLVVRPGAGALAVLWIIGSFAILFGILLIVVAFELRGLQSKLGAASERVKERVSDLVD